ncbi:MAG: glycosyltransferase family 2 protein [Thermoleophilia bacterium]|nr:glycosyltransferase family 2 protein [Thermoleophilia bacterium]
MTRLALTVDAGDPASWAPAVAAYVAHSRERDGFELVLTEVESAIPTPVLGQMVEEVCRHASGGGSFGAISLGHPDGSADAVTVTTPAEVRERLGVSEPDVPTNAGEIVEVARTGKWLLDRLVATRDRHIFERTYVRLEGVPKVSVRIPTWRKPELLVCRAIASALNGRYPDIEVVVCSDGPDPEARRMVEAVQDPRVVYREVPERPNYASHSTHFWMTAGSHAANGALDACTGDVIAPLDHDDAFTETHINELLTALDTSGADAVWGQALCESRNGSWAVWGSAPLRKGYISHGSVLYTRALAHFRFDPHCWLIEEPGDWNMWRRMADAGATFVHLPQVVLVHFKELTSIEDDPSLTEAQLATHDLRATTDQLATDVLGTDARMYLDVSQRDPAAVRASAA